MNITRLRRRAARQPAALRVLAAARRCVLEVVAVNGHRLRYDVRSAFDAGLLGDLITHEAEILAVLEQRPAILYRAALRRCWAASATGTAAPAARTAAIHDEMERAR